ncbi:SDR family oxidoreductase [Sphingobium sp.]|uniref:SDR family NAD(P)-dependent oxidoreductase n=1 Tax=Sphingobium sp. TaxID=1912891 RepID=UPI0028BEC5B1|nr:SDR family oxidoreductase [Sphingobium sp.]
MGMVDGKVALILGAGTAANMGQSIAARFAAEGASVMVGGRDGDELARFAQAINGASAVCDIACQDDLDALVAATIDRFGRLDIAVNATGLNQVKPFLNVSLEELRRITDVQFIGTFLFMQAVLRRMADNGSIIQISSVSASALLPNHAAYMATKAAGDVLVRALAAEFGVRGIRVNSIAPGPTEDTPMAANALADEAVRQRIRNATPLRRLGTAADIAEAALWLASDKSFITGEVLQVNGGRAIPRLG